MSNKKYLRKNEFRYHTGPNTRRPDGKGHVVYVTAKQGHKAKINVITHSKTFFGEPTYSLISNPEIEPEKGRPKDKRQSRFSVPRWENDKYLQQKPKGIWHLSKVDRIRIKKVNKWYTRKKQ